jgi:hypothetical protein
MPARHVGPNGEETFLGSSRMLISNGELIAVAVSRLVGSDLEAEE